MGLSAERKNDFIEFMLEADVLRLGTFTTKSGRESPYFINSGRYRSGAMLKKLGDFFAELMVSEFGNEFDGLYGPAYKGIPLASAAAVSLSTGFARDVSVTFNRKEVKDHGEGGALIGETFSSESGPKPKVVIIEDVITAGTSVRETLEILKGKHVDLVGLVVSVDRMEKGDGNQGAMVEVQEKYGLKAASLISIKDLIAWLSEESKQETYDPTGEHLAKINRYYREYGAA
ncbi:MAG: orotate phosphoribosyltransferase [Myxococcota bacterium]|nr:orotate phosphoribosyltransferase [Myxococcota bacterium]